MKLRKGRSNAESLFHLSEIPSDNQIRNLLDPVSPKYVAPVYRQIFLALEQTNVLEKRRSFANQLLVAIDGTEYFSSKAICCDSCSQRELNNGKTNYFHSAFTPVIVQAGNETVISLEPEFIVPQDGHEKQDCEIQAAKRWVEKWGDFYAKRGVVIQGDDLFSRDPFCQALKGKGLHLILVCKPDSHPFLYETVNFLAASGVLAAKVVRRWAGRYAEIYTYRYANQLHLNSELDSLTVGWCEVTVTREDTGEQLYKNAFITDFEVTDTNVEAIVRAGRSKTRIIKS